MKWFFALGRDSMAFDHYANMLQVAFYTAMKHNPGLEPVFLYDGENDGNHLLKWLEDKPVTIINKRTSFYNEIKSASGIDKTPWAFSAATGAFLRVEIPAIMAERGWKDKFVLYTDCDVMFMKNCVDHFKKLKPEYFTVGPEFTKINYTAMNTGVMIMNIENLMKTLDSFMRHIRENMDEFVNSSYDQAAYRSYYAGKYDHLPLEYNWKPYWGSLGKAAIIHFHGPKPYQRHALLNGRMPEYFEVLGKIGYYKACLMWEKNLIDAFSDRIDKKPFTKNTNLNI